MTNLDGIIAAARSRQGKQAEVKPQDSTLPLERIQMRQQDTRSLNPSHVDSLAESIAVLGLIEPLVTDSAGRLLAGGHRLAAITALKESQPDNYNKQFPGDRIPIRMLPFDAEEEPELALQIEIAENEQRRDYTPAEVKAIADRLRISGYVDVKGRPKKGQKALMPALAVVVGKHLRTVQRYLSDDEQGRKEPEKTTTSVVLLKKALKILEQWEASPGDTGAAGSKLQSKLPEIKKMLDDAIAEMDSM